MNAKTYIKQLLSTESYSFSWDEVSQSTTSSHDALKLELHRLTSKGEIINLRKGFYLIVTPRYASSKKLPVQLYCEKLFAHLRKKYYIGLFSAAKFHGASHQQIHRDYLITEKPKLNEIRKNAFDLRFFTSTHWSEKNILQKQADAGIFKISSPALTIVDLIHYQTKLGGINRVLAVIEELSEVLEATDVKNLLEWYPNKSTLQRFGFILETLNVQNHCQSLILEALEPNKYFPVLLRPQANKRPGAVNNKWKVVANVKLESDL